MSVNRRYRCYNTVMLPVVSFFKWWYGDGIKLRLKATSVRIDGVTDYFSFSLLLKTLFSPFRQISAGSVDGSLDVKMRAMVDKLFSRVIGAVVRLLIILVGFVALAVVLLFSLASLLVWILLPTAPVAGLVLMTIGWTP